MSDSSYQAVQQPISLDTPDKDEQPVPESVRSAGLEEEASKPNMLSWISVERFKTFIEILFLIITAATAVIALREYQNTNRVASRQQLYETEQLISSREIENPRLLELFLDPPANVTPEQYSLAMLHLTMPDTDLTGVDHVSKAYDVVWRYGSLTSDHEHFIRVYLQAETYLYHLHNVYDYMREGVLTKDEGDTWLGLIGDIGPHPIFLTAIYAAHENDYLSENFADELRDRLMADDENVQVLSAFYPEMLEPTWVDKLPSY